jgi:hypothetical protein
MRVIVCRAMVALIRALFCRENSMFTRTKRSIAHFAAPFVLRGLDGIQPAGDYDIDEDEDEEMIEGLSWLAYRRVATFIHIPDRDPNQRRTQLVAIDYLELETTLNHDQETIK